MEDVGNKRAHKEVGLDYADVVQDVKMHEREGPMQGLAHAKNRDQEELLEQLLTLEQENEPSSFLALHFLAKHSRAPMLKYHLIFNNFKIFERWSIIYTFLALIPLF